MRAFVTFILVASSAPSSSQTLDRVLASIGNAAITESDVEAEDRFEIFLGEQRSPAVPGSTAFERVRDRLVDQKLLAQEADLQGLERQDFSTAAANRLTEIRRRYGREGAFQSALRGLGMSEPQVIERLEEQERVLRLIDERLRPRAVVEESDVRTYYRDVFLLQYQRHENDPAPPLGEVEKRIREILVEKKINQLLSEWLEQLRVNHRVKIHTF